MDWLKKYFHEEKMSFPGFLVFVSLFSLAGAFTGTLINKYTMYWQKVSDPDNYSSTRVICGSFLLLQVVFISILFYLFRLALKENFHYWMTSTFASYIFFTLFFARLFIYS